MDIQSLPSDLREFIQTHFRDEEALMLRYHNPGYAEQKREHDVFIDLVCEYQKDLLKSRPAAAINLFNAWWGRRGCDAHGALWTQRATRAIDDVERLTLQ